jgi:GDP-6-deoxy-D-talose 4-dehydrogenase
LVYRSERVLITGASGFTGRPLVERLRQSGREIIGLGDEASDTGVFKIDMRDLEGLTRALAQTHPNAIVHLAGIAAPTYGNIGDLYSANVVGTANLFGALATAKIEPEIVIVASSAQVYAARDESGPLTEDCPLGPNTHYAASKRATEDIARIYSNEFPIIITRPFNYTGPGQTPNFLVPKIVQHYAEGKSEIYLGNLDLYRDFSDVRRVVEAYLRLVSDAIDPNTINICSGRTVYLSDILKMMEEISGRSLELVTDMSLFRSDEPHVIVGSASRLESLVGPLPNPDFRETLLNMYRACQQQIDGIRGG